MSTAPSPYIFQAAVELPLSLALNAQGDSTGSMDYKVTVAVERLGLDEMDVVMDFRVLETSLSTVLEPMHGHSLQDLGLKDLADAAKSIAESIAPSIPGPVRLASVSIENEAGRQMTLQL